MKTPFIKFSLPLLALSLVLNSGFLPQQVAAEDASISNSPPAGHLRGKGSSPNKTGYSNEQIVHLLNRISFGPAPGDIENVKQLGVNAYIEQQLHPQSIQLSDNLKNLDQLPALSETPAYLFQTYGRPTLKAFAQAQQAGDTAEAKKDLQKVVSQTYQKLYEDDANARIARAVYSPRQLEEVMTDFWYNHFNISIDKNLDHLWVGAYEQSAIRPFALGRFRDLVGATAHHAAMLFYLDNWQNTAPGSQAARGRFNGINENYARELMELHTLGVDGGYTQKDVQELARVLTGLGLAPGTQQQGQQKQRPNNANALAQGGGFNAGGFNGRRRMMAARGFWERPNGGGGGFGQMQNMAEMASAPAANVNAKFGSYFDARRHDFGEKVIMGHRFQGSGENEIEQVLDMLCKQPATAHHICFQLAQYFISDKPPEALVDKMSKKFLDSDGEIPAVLETLFHSPEFWEQSTVNAKFKSPYRFLISSLRASNAELGEIRPSIQILTQLGQPLYKCLTPDGYKNTKDAWLNPDNLLNRINFATALGSGHWRGATINVKDPADVADCIGPTLSDKTIDAVMKSPENMRVALILGSPEFQKY